MSSAFPLITEWIRKKEDWLYIHESRIRSRAIDANQELDIPIERRIYAYPEMVICAILAMFDHSLCGIRLRWDPEYDSKRDFSVFNIALGSSPSDNLVYARLPPQTPPGIFIVHIPSFWPSINTLRLSVFNSDTVRHYFLGHGYVLAAKKKVGES